ncbi:TonB family protein [Pseudomonas sp. 14P_8.1_Bac3]|uniref:TonB family protein n=1 Tax=Pseudomonas sp. 14P_8.1_Bac3 TaxID=2971621 RepID=UPI0021CAD4B7|nr:energy transducer TonB [Pseudomonas sp. 14P_8.1_Bac3]MCU1760985.1 TonB family protein [Pseudomonas sp. 14P_8.1_Bac3]
MTAMTMHSPLMTTQRSGRSGFWQNSLAASLAVALHGIVLALLVHGWSPDTPRADPPAVLRTQLVMLPPAPPLVAPPPTPALVEPTPPEPVVAAPVKPAVDPQLQAQKLEQAALARKRVEDKKRDLQAEQQRQRLESEQRSREAEQQRVAEQQAQHAEQARLNAERARQQSAQAAANSRQYLPLSKEAPDYPERALDKHIEGDCTVEYTVNPQGKIENPKVLDGCHPLFIRPSLAAANTFRYQPKVVDGQVVSVPAVRNTFHYRIK